MVLTKSLKAGVCAFAVSVAVLSAPAPALAQNDPVVAVVNGEKIMRSEVEKAHGQLPAQYQQVPLEQIFPALLNSVIDTRLTAAAARAEKVEQSDRYKSELASFSERLLGAIVIEAHVEKTVTDATVNARYAQIIKDTGSQAQVHARHILLKTEDEAKAVIKELAGGADFAELAKKRSTGPSGATGGDLGFFGKGQMVPEFEKAAFAMDKGAVTKKPVKTQFGWHVIKVEDKRTPAPPSQAEMEPQIRQSLMQEAASAYTKGLRDKAKIERFNFDGTPAK